MMLTQELALAVKRGLLPHQSHPALAERAMVKRDGRVTKNRLTPPSSQMLCLLNMWKQLQRRQPNNKADLAVQKPRNY